MPGFRAAACDHRHMSDTSGTEELRGGDPRERRRGRRSMERARRPTPRRWSEPPAWTPTECASGSITRRVAAVPTRGRVRRTRPAERSGDAFQQRFSSATPNRTAGVPRRDREPARPHDSGAGPWSPGTSALSVRGGGPGPRDALGLVRELRERELDRRGRRRDARRTPRAPALARATADTDVISMSPHQERRPKICRKNRKMLRTSMKMAAASGIASSLPARRKRLKSTTV